jgi:hypothetical protein|tara:strand:+ start:30349 stop:30591 length:243 start_codon:yes stop_codon:yes gene_type:complete
MADDATWDTSKENFQPLKKGREAKILNEVVAMPTDERAAKIKEERRYVRTPLRSVADCQKPKQRQLGLASTFLVNFSKHF